MVIILWWLGMCCTWLALAWLNDRHQVRPAPGVGAALVVVWPAGLPLLIGSAGALGKDRGGDLLP